MSPAAQQLDGEDRAHTLQRLGSEKRSLPNDTHLISITPGDELLWHAKLRTKDAAGQYLQYNVDLIFPPGYPVTPPEVHFRDQFAHPNVTREGQVCLPILREEWTPSLRAADMLVRVRSALEEAVPGRQRVAAPVLLGAPVPQIVQRRLLLRFSQQLSELSYLAGPDLEDGGKRGFLTAPTSVGEAPPPRFTMYKAVCQSPGEEGGKERHACQWFAAAPEGDPHTLYIAFRGTASAADVFKDVQFDMVRTPAGARVHSGSYIGVQDELGDIMDVVRGRAQEGQLARVIFCGHSLGGAYAMAAMAELFAKVLRVRGSKSTVCVEAITFGAPLVFAVNKGVFELPSAWPRSELPRLTDVVFGLDVVPRALLLGSDSLKHLARYIPRPSSVSWVASWFWPRIVNRALLPCLEQVADASEALRSAYVPVGNFIYVPPPTEAGNFVADEYGMSVWPNDPVAGRLRIFPGFDDGALDKEILQGIGVGGVEHALLDHTLSAGYRSFVLSEWEVRK